MNLFESIDFCADSLVKLTHGITAYRFLEPSNVTDDAAADKLPLIVCLHGNLLSSR